MKMWEPTECPGTEELKDRLQTAREKLARQQMLLKEKKLPVLVLMEGWGTAGKGNCIGRVIQNIDPRFFNVESLEKKTEEEKRKPFLYRYFKRLPEAGKFAFFDSGWMDETVQEKLSGDLTEKTYADRIESVRRLSGHEILPAYFRKRAGKTDGSSGEKSRYFLADQQTGCMAA